MVIAHKRQHDVKRPYKAFRLKDITTFHLYIRAMATPALNRWNRCGASNPPTAGQELGGQLDAVMGDLAQHLWELA